MHYSARRLITDATSKRSTNNPRRLHEPGKPTAIAVTTSGVHLLRVSGYLGSGGSQRITPRRTA